MINLNTFFIFIQLDGQKISIVPLLEACSRLIVCCIANGGTAPPINDPSEHTHFAKPSPQSAQSTIKSLRKKSGLPNSSRTCGIKTCWMSLWLQWGNQ